jgi:ferrochelatase
MKIEDILNLTEGSLETAPEIHAIEGATAYPSKVDHGDLFFSSNPEDIATAIANGAFAIVYDDESLEITDTEIAWIKVASLKESAFRLLRYILLSKEADFHLLDPHEMSFLRMILTHKTNITFLPNEWSKAFEQILNGEVHLFFSTDEELMRLIKPESSKLTNSTNDLFILRYSQRYETYFFTNILSTLH